jgi:hypothetical protein
MDDSQGSATSLTAAGSSSHASLPSENDAERSARELDFNLAATGAPIPVVKRSKDMWSDSSLWQEPGPEQLINLADLEFDRACTMGQTRPLDEDYVLELCQGMKDNPPTVPLRALVWRNQSHAGM